MTDAYGAYTSSLDPLRVAGIGDVCSATRKGSRGLRLGLRTSVTASRMTDAYGANTPVGVHRSPLFTMSG